MALFIALALEPLVRWLGKHGMSRGMSIAVVSVGFAVFLGGVLAIVIPMVAVQITQFVRRAMDRLDSQLDDAYCETHALIYQLDSTIGQWELEELEPAQH